MTNIRGVRTAVFTLALLSTALLPFAALPAGAQSTSPAPAATSVPWPVKIVLSAQLLAGLPRHEATVDEEHGGTATYSGVQLGDVLAKAGVPRGPGLRGRGMTVYALVLATDGYRVLFALPELDPAFTDKLVLLADERNGQPLGAALAPFRVVIPSEKRQARWIRNAVEVDVDVLPPAAGPPPGAANGPTHGT